MTMYVPVLSRRSAAATGTRLGQRPRKDAAGSRQAKLSVRQLKRAEPVHGPYAESWFDAAAGKHRLRLTPEGKAKAAEYLLRYPHPIRLLIATWPAAYRAARIARLTDEEIDALCLEGVALAFARYDPTRGAAVGTAIVWGLRAAVGNAVRQARRARDQVIVDFSALANRCEDVSIESVRVRTPAAASTGHGSHSVADDMTEAIGRADLSAREEAILARRFGLNGELPRTNANIGAELGISPERVRQVQELAIRKIRNALGLDVAWPAIARDRVLRRLAATSQPESKSEISQRTGVPKWQLRQVLAELTAEGAVVRERRIISRSRWCVVYHLASKKKRSRSRIAAKMNSKIAG